MSLKLNVRSITRFNAPLSRPLRMYSTAALRLVLGADLSETNLTSANLGGANLGGGRDIVDRWMVSTKIINTNLRSVYFAGVDLRGVDLSAVKDGSYGLTSRSLADAVYDDTTTWPDAVAGQCDEVSVVFDGCLVSCAGDGEGDC